MAHTKQKILNSGETWVLPMNHRACDFEATVVVTKELAEMGAVYLTATLSPITEMVDELGNGATWFEYADPDALSAWLGGSAGNNLVLNISKPVVALKFETSGDVASDITVQVIQAGR